MPRLRVLDSLRGFAAIYVVFFHTLALRPKIQLPYPVLSEAINFGYTGVYRFFVISGFSLSMTMPRHDKHPVPWLSYTVSRLFRITPCFFVMLIVSVAIRYLELGEVYTLGRILTSASFLFNLVPGHQEGIVAASWTIGVEMLFYVVFIPLYRLGPRLQIIVAIASLAMFWLARPFMSADYAQWTILGYFPIFVVGMIAFEAYADLRSLPRARHIGVAAIVSGLVVLGFCLALTRGEHALAYRAPIGVGYALLLVGCAMAQPRILEAKVLAFYGTVSYSLYLVHAPVINAFRSLFTGFASAYQPLIAYGICVTIVLVVASALAYTLYRFVEHPGIQAGKHVLDRAPV